MLIHVGGIAPYSTPLDIRHTLLPRVLHLSTQKEVCPNDNLLLAFGLSCGADYVCAIGQSQGDHNRLGHVLDWPACIPADHSESRSYAAPLNKKRAASPKRHDPTNCLGS